MAIASTIQWQPNNITRSLNSNNNDPWLHFWYCYNNNTTQSLRRKAQRANISPDKCTRLQAREIRFRMQKRYVSFEWFDLKPPTSCLPFFFDRKSFLCWSCRIVLQWWMAWKIMSMWYGKWKGPPFSNNGSLISSFFSLSSARRRLLRMALNSFYQKKIPLSPNRMRMQVLIL